MHVRVLSVHNVTDTWSFASFPQLHYY
jgi:hypothetical protein